MGDHTLALSHHGLRPVIWSYDYGRRAPTNPGAALPFEITRLPAPRARRVLLSRAKSAGHVSGTTRGASSLSASHIICHNLALLPTAAAAKPPETGFVAMVLRGDPSAEWGRQLWVRLAKRHAAAVNVVLFVGEPLRSLAKELFPAHDPILLRNGARLVSETFEVPDGLRECFRIVAIGNLARHKGFDVLLRAVAGAQEALPHAIQVDILGVGPEDARLRALAKSLGLATRVNFFGRVGRSEVARALMAGDAFAMPSRRDAFGLAAAEAALARCPLLLSDATGISVELMGRSACLVHPAGDETVLASDIVRLAMSPRFAASIATNANHLVHETMTWARVAQTYLDITKRFVS